MSAFDVIDRGPIDLPRLRDRIHGCLAGIAVGDALGFPAHDLDIDEVLERFGGPLERFHAAMDDDPIHAGHAAGRITDDTILTMVTADAVLSAPQQPSTEDMALALYRWGRANQDVWRPGNVFGPSTKAALDELLDTNGRFVLRRSRGRAHDGASNGAPMRMAPAGLIHPGDPEAAAHTACFLALPTHPTQVAIAAAAALAAGVAAALAAHAEVLEVVQATLLGARQGEQWGRKHARTVPAPSIERRIQLAVQLALVATDPLAAARELHAVLGGNLQAAEALPVAVGVFVASGGDPTSAVVAAASAGGDSDTIASMSGGLGGALRGLAAIRDDLVREIERVNGLDLASLASRLADRAVRAIS